MVRSYLTNVSHVPYVETVIIVDHGYPGILLIIGNSTGVRVDSVTGVGGHVGDGQPLGYVHPQEVGPRQGGDELEGLGREAPHNALSTADENKLLSD